MPTFNSKLLKVFIVMLIQNSIAWGLNYSTNIHLCITNIMFMFRYSTLFKMMLTPACSIHMTAWLLNTIDRAVFPDVTVAPFLFIAGTDSKHYTTIADSILRFMPIRMTAQDITLPHNANERIGLHAFKYVQKHACG